MEKILHSSEQRRAELIKGLIFYRQQRQFCDCQIHINEQVLYVHRNVISSLSPYFSDCFQDGYTQDHSNELVLSEFVAEPETVCLVFDYAYTGEISIDKSNVANLLVVADSFGIIEIKKLCATFIEENFHFRDSVKFLTFNLVDILASLGKTHTNSKERRAEIINNLNLDRHLRQFCDFEIHIADRIFYVHRNIISSLSTYFSDLFQEHRRERCSTNDNKLTLVKPITADAVSQVIDYAYTGDIVIDESNVESLFIITSFMKIKEIEELCIAFIEKNLVYKSCFDWLTLSESMNLVSKIKFRLAYWSPFFEKLEYLRRRDKYRRNKCVIKVVAKKVCSIGE